MLVLTAAAQGDQASAAVELAKSFVVAPIFDACHAAREVLEMVTAQTACCSITYWANPVVVVTIPGEVLRQRAVLVLPAD